MNENEEPIEITILNEEPKVVSSEQAADQGTLSKAASKMGEAAQNAAQKAWESEARKKVTDRVNETAAKQKEAISEAVSKAVNERIDVEKERMKRKVRETDWKEVAKTGARLGLKGLSAGMGLLAKKLKPNERPTAAGEEPSEKKES